MAIDTDQTPKDDVAVSAGPPAEQEPTPPSVAGSPPGQAGEAVETAPVAVERDAAIQEAADVAEQAAVPTQGMVGESGEAGEVEPSAESLDRILAMKVPMIVRIARKKMRFSEVLKLHLGTVIPFEQDAYQHIDLMVNNAVIGLGQAVKVGENFGLKIVEMGEITERIRSLGVEDAGSAHSGQTAEPRP